MYPFKNGVYPRLTNSTLEKGFTAPTSNGRESRKEASYQRVSPDNDPDLAPTLVEKTIP